MTNPDPVLAFREAMASVKDYTNYKIIFATVVIMLFSLVLSLDTPEGVTVSAYWACLAIVIFGLKGITWLEIR